MRQNFCIVAASVGCAVVGLLIAGCRGGSANPSRIGGWGAGERRGFQGIEFVRVPGGTFRMGHPEHRPPVHAVRVSGFWMSRYEVTNAQFEAFRKRRRTPKGAGGDDPVCGVSREDAEAFCAWLSKRGGRRYRLPTDAEWEYAARAGLDQKDFPWGDDASEVRANIGEGRPRRVGSFAPNAFGL